MKRTKRFCRWLALLLGLCLLTCSLPSCVFLWASRNLSGSFEQPENRTTVGSRQETGTTAPKPEPNAPLLGDETLAYHLSEADASHFRELLAECLAAILEWGTERSEEAEEKILAVEDAFDHISTQSAIAQIRYYLMPDDPQREAEELFSAAMEEDARTEYYAMCQQIDESTAPLRTLFFSDWTEEDLALMRSYSGSVAELRKENDQLLAQYHALSDDKFEQGSADLFFQMFANNALIAEEMGYDDYPSYAYETEYQRDYTPQEAIALHDFVKAKVVPLLPAVKNRLFGAVSKLTRQEYDVFQAAFEGTYEAGKTLLSEYLSTYPQEVRDRMTAMFEDAAVADSERAIEAAFTTYLYEFDRPLCYFGPGYQSSYTVVHEMGHYYAASSTQTLGVQLDLAETHSNGNEWLYTVYLANRFGGTLGEVVFYYELYIKLCSIVISTLVDEFEQSVYRNVPAKAEEFDSRMISLCDGYGGYEWLCAYVTDPLTYWRLVVLESPCYYISYAVASINAIQLGILAQEDYGNAQQVYRSYTEELPEDGMTCTEWLSKCGIESPFDEKAYQRLQGLV